MCSKVRIDGVVCSTPRQLATHLGSEQPLEWLEHRGGMDWCLCVIDVPRTLQHSRLKWSHEGASNLFVVER
ncbi:MAG: hypothetical protein EOR16_32390 [Mesorhizobium sp.]|nr:MAG: hypothetical protein EOR16_32390 [Mesorhizobium sp.]